MPEEALERVIEAVCEVFEVRPEDLPPQGFPPGQRDLTWARTACAMLARESARVTVQAMGKRLGYPVGGRTHNMDRQGRVWLRWAARDKPPKRRWDVTLFRRRFEKVCARLGADVEKIAAR